MSERIKELIKSCGIIPEDEHYEVAELIVKECMNLTEGCRDKYLNSAPYKIAEHFGVE